MHPSKRISRADHQSRMILRRAAQHARRTSLIWRKTNIRALPNGRPYTRVEAYQQGIKISPHPSPGNKPLIMPHLYRVRL